MPLTIRGRLIDSEMAAAGATPCQLVGKQANKGTARTGVVAHLVMLVLQATSPHNLKPLPAQRLATAIHCHSRGSAWKVCPWS